MLNVILRGLHGFHDTWPEKLEMVLLLVGAQFCSEVQFCFGIDFVFGSFVIGGVCVVRPVFRGPVLL